MGTTLTAILFAGNRLGLVHIGDSRGYLLRDGELAQITKDDTFVQTLVDEGRITAEEAHSHPQRSLIMRALTGHEVEPTLIMREARAGDRYLLCSDGLSDPVSHDTILEALQIDVAESADRLIELALRGGPDNVTVVVADVIDYDYGQTQPILAGAVSGDDDHVAPPNTAAGRASAFNPRRNSQTCCAATRRAGAATAVATPDGHRGGAAGSARAGRAGDRPGDRAQQLLRQRARRHGGDHAWRAQVDTRLPPSRALPTWLPDIARRAQPNQPGPVPTIAVPSKSATSSSRATAGAIGSANGFRRRGHRPDQPTGTDSLLPICAPRAPATTSPSPPRPTPPETPGEGVIHAHRAKRRLRRLRQQ